MDLLKLEDFIGAEVEDVIRFFIEISKIPRRSGEESRIRKYLEDFAEQRNLRYVKDEYENIIIYKNSTFRRNEETLALQAHTDMICEKEQGILHNFSEDPIILYKDGDFIKAKGTTLGADNGIGMAFMLAILNSNLSIPNLECIFTSQEETTMLGVIKIDEKNINARKIISLDNGKEGEILTSSANCNEWIAKIKAGKEKIYTDKIFRLRYDNFKGGHSGGNIGDEKRGNPIKLAMEVLKNLKDVQIVSLKGGSRVNVIPREFTVDFYMPENENEIIEKVILKQKEIFKNEIIEIEEKEVADNIKGYSIKNSKKIIDFVNEYKNGALGRDIDGNVILSANLAVLGENENGIQIEFSERSNLKALENDYKKELLDLLEKYQIKIVWHQELKGVERKSDNELLIKCQQAYKKLYGKNLKEIISQGVVEGGFFVDKILDCEYVCIGPDIYNAHSPSEKVSISSVKNVWGFLKEMILN